MTKHILLILLAVVLVQCSPGMDADHIASDANQDLLQTPVPAPGPPPSSVKDDAQVSLDSEAESFSASIKSRLLGSRYMEKNCHDLNQWMSWSKVPMKWCRYKSGGQNAEVLMLNPGPRRLTQWIFTACRKHSRSVAACSTKTFNHIMAQSGAQFPVAGVVIEDMDGNGRGNAYAFRNGVTVQIAAFGTATETLITDAQISKSFTDVPLRTYSYARVASTTRDQLTRYAASVGLKIPALGSSGEQKNVFNEVTGSLYLNAWSSSTNHLISAWVFAQGF